MTNGRRTFTDEFKREAVALLASSGRPLMQVAAELGIQPSMLRSWRGGAPRTAATTTPRVPSPAEQAAEIARLKRELDRTRQERDVLKNHLGGRPPVGAETAGAYPRGGRERPTAFWWRVTPSKNMVHGLLRA